MEVRGAALGRVIAAVVFGIGPGAWTGVVTSAAQADTPQCSLVTHCYSILVAGDTSSTLEDGMYGTWNRAAMGAGCSTSSHAYINSEMWFWPFANSGAGWVEEGDKAGWLGGACDYYAFTEWQPADGSAFTERVLATLNHNDATTDEFQISHAPTTDEFRIYFDGAYVTSGDVDFWTSRRMELGGEVATSQGTSDLFTMYGRALDNAGNQTLLPSPKTTRVDVDLYGNHANDSQWQWRVPA